MVMSFSFLQLNLITEYIYIYRLCIETPRTGTRLLQTADEDLLKLAKERELMGRFDLPHNPVIFSP